MGVCECVCHYCMYVICCINVVYVCNDASTAG